MDTTRYWATLTTRRISRRRAITGASALGAGAMALGLLGCGGSNNDQKSTKGPQLITTPSDTTSRAKPGGTLKDFQAVDPLHMDALQSSNSSVINLVAVYAYPQLLHYKTVLFPKVAEGDIDGDSARSFELSPDGLQIALKVRPGMKWDMRAPTNGRALDAQDVVFSWNKFVKLHPSAPDLASVESIAAPDNETVVLKLSKYDASVVSLLADNAHLYIMPRESDGGFDPKATVRGHGPWLLDDYVPSARMVWSKNPNYWQAGRPFFDKIEKPILSDYASRLAQFRTGSIYTNVVSAADMLPTLREIPATKLYQGDQYPTSLNVLGFGFEGDSIFKDVRVRQALALSLDREAAIDVLYERKTLADQGIELGYAYNTIVGAGFHSYWLNPQDKTTFGENAKYFTLDVAEGKKLLAAAGHADGAKFDFVTNAENTFGDLYARQRDIYDGMFRAVGFVPTQKNVTYAQFISTSYNKAYATGKGFTGLILRAWANQATIDQFLQRQLRAGGNNFSGSTADGNDALSGDPKINAAIDQLVQERDGNKRISLSHDLIRYHSGQVYNIPTPVQVKTLTVAWPVIGNMGVYSAPANANDQTGSALQWWFDDSKRPASAT